MDLRAFDRVSYQLVYFELMILGCTVHCRFRLSDCTVIHCASACPWMTKNQKVQLH